MANQVTVNGNTYRDDAHPTQGLDNNGHRVRLIPLFSDTLIEIDTRITAGQASIDATADVVEADRLLAQGAKNAAEAAADAAADSALSAINSPGTQATSASSMTVGLGSKSLTLAQTGKAFVPGQYVTIARTSAPTTWMVAAINTHNAATGDVNVTVTGYNGSGTHTDWTVVHGAPIEVIPDKTGKAGYVVVVNGTENGLALALLRGLPDPAGHIGELLTVNAAGVQEWATIRQLKPGAVLQTCESLSVPDWLAADGSIYLQSSYPAVAALVGKIEDGGTTWTAGSGVSSNVGNLAGVPLDYLNGLWLLGGYNGTTSEVRTSSDGITFTHRTNGSSTVASFSAFAWGAGLYVAVGGTGDLRTSADGTSWTARTSQFGSGHIYGVAYNGSNLFVAVGGGATNKVATSADGITWTGRGTSQTAGSINGVAYGAGLFVAVTGITPAEIKTTTDGVTWTSRTNPLTGAGIMVRWVNGEFWMSTSTNKLARSADGINWTEVANPLGANVVYGVAAGNGRLIVCGAAGLLSVSDDNGATWAARTSGFASTAVKGIACNGSRFVIAGDSKLGYNTPFSYSTASQFVTPTISVSAPVKAYLKS